MSSAPIQIHVHGEVHIHFPPTGDIPLPLFNQLKELIIMNMEELKTELETVATDLTGVGTALAEGEVQLEKSLDELVVAIGNVGTTTPAVDAALATLKTAAAALAGKGAAIKTVAQSLDDLVVDTPPGP